MKAPIFEIGLSIAVLLVSSLVVTFSLGGDAGLTVFSLGLFFIFPFYFILNNFDLETDEKIVLSFFISIGVLPIFVYWLGFLVSFRTSLWISVGLMWVAAYGIHKMKK